VSEAVNLTVNDGASTPVEVTFTPEMVSGGNATFRDGRLGVSNLMPRISNGTSLSSTSRPTNRVTHRVSLPVTKTVDGQDVLDFILRAEATFVLPERATTQNRKDLLAYFVNSLNEDLIKATVVDVSPIWG
jgi:hypothetical protein